MKKTKTITEFSHLLTQRQREKLVAAIALGRGFSGVKKMVFFRIKDITQKKELLKIWDKEVLKDMTSTECLKLICKGK